MIMENKTGYQYIDILLEMPSNAINPEWNLDEGDFDYAYYIEDLQYVRSDWTTDELFYPTTIVYGLAFLVGIIGNSIVVFALVADKKAHNVTNSFLVSLAIADIMFLSVCVPYETVVKFRGYLSDGDVFCKAVGFIETLSATASIWNLTIVSIERYIVIVHPMKSRTLCTFGRTKKIIVIVWFAAALMSAPVSYVLDTKDTIWYNNESFVLESTCGDSNFNSNQERIVFAWYQLLVMFVIPSCIMAYCYCLVIRVLWLSTQQLAKMTGTGTKYQSNSQSNNESSQALQSDPAKRGDAATSQTANGSKKATRFGRVSTDQSHEMKEARKQVIKMLLTIIIIFLLSWGPKLIYSVMKRHEWSQMRTTVAFQAQLVINLLPYLQSAANPLIYSFMSNNFRRSMRSAVQRYCPCCRCCLSPHPAHSHHHVRLHKLHTNSSSGYMSGPTTAFTLD